MPLNSDRDQRILVSIVLLSHNRPKYLVEALAALKRQSCNDLEIIVVDNPSSASLEVASIVGRYPDVRLIRNSENIGYAGGMNRGIEQAGGAYVLLTEDDIVLDNDCVQVLVDYAREHPEADLIAPIIYNKSDRSIRCAGGEFELSPMYRMRIHGAGDADNGQFPAAFDVGYIDGATMFASASFWQQFIGFREEYFMYWEAVELCVRVIRESKKMTIVPQAKVFHFDPPDGVPAGEIAYHQTKNFFVLYLLHAELRFLPEFIFRHMVINGIRTVLGRTNTSPKIFLRALMWMLGQTPSLIMERFRRARRPRLDKRVGWQVSHRERLPFPPEL